MKILKPILSITLIIILLIAIVPTYLVKAQQPEPPKIYTVTINYIYDDAAGTLAAQPYIATVGGTAVKPQTIVSPIIEGYTPDKSQVVLDFKNYDKDTNIFVKYSPNTVTYYVKHYTANLDGTNELAETETLQAKVGETVNAKAKVYPGFSVKSPLANSKVPTKDKSLTLDVFYNRNTYTLEFDSDGGSYVAGGVYPFEAPIEVKDPTRQGYAFNGWTPALPATMPAEEVTVKANWIEDDSTPYTINYFVQDATGDGYTFISDTVGHGITGETPIFNVPATGEVPGLIFPQLTPRQQRNWRYTYEYNQTKTETENQDEIIKGDGSGSIDVYFDRKEVTIMFGSDPTIAVPWEPEITINGETYNKDKPYQVKVRFGQDLAPYWPFAKNINNIPPGDAISSYVFYKGTLKTGQMDWVTVPPIPSFVGTTYFYYPGSDWQGTKNLKYIRIDLSSSDTFAPVTINYFMQDLAGKYPMDPEFTEDFSQIKSRIGYGTKNISGFSLDKTKFMEGEDAFSIDWTEENGVKTKGTVNAWYIRNKYNVNVYTDLDSTTPTTIEGVYYDTPLKDVVKTPERPDSVPASFVFAGWYQNVLRDISFDINQNMPDHELNLFAKWAHPTNLVTVTIDYNVGGENEIKQVAIGDKIARPTVPENPGFRFLGWKEIVDDTEPASYFDFQKPINDNTLLRAIWEPLQLSTIE